MSSPEALTAALGVDWILQEPCVATWKDTLDNSREYSLGDACSVTLWIGTRPAERLWVAMLQVTITTKLCNREKQFDFFLFMDPHQVKLTPAHNSIATSTFALASLLKAFPVPHGGGWLHIAVEQEHSKNYVPGRVLMEARPPGTLPFTDMGLHLLMQTRALSQAAGFEIYISNSRGSRKALNRVGSQIPKQITTINIDVCETYQGRGGGWDIWGQYGKELAGPHRLEASKNTAAPIHEITVADTSVISQDPSTPPSLKRAPGSQEESSLQKRMRYFKSMYPDLSPTEENTPSTTRGRPSQQSTQYDQPPRDDHAAREEWLAQAHESTRDDNTSQQDESTQGDQATQQSQTPKDGQATQNHASTQSSQQRHASQDAANRAQFPDLEGTLSPFQDVQVPPYTASMTSSEPDQRLDIKPTLFSRGARNHDPPALTSGDLGDLITAAVQAQIPAIAAQVQQRILSAEMTALAQTSIAEHISAHMPSLMQSHLSDLHDEWDSASASLHETKDEAITDIHSERDTALKEIQEESQTCYDDFKEKTEQFKEDFITDVEDKCGKFEDRIMAQIDTLSPQDMRDMGTGRGNSAKDAVRLFQRDHQRYLTPEQQVKVLLSIAKWNNAEVFMAAGADMQEALVKHWAGAADWVSNSAPASL